MPATDALQPPLTPAERKIVKSYGGWTQFMMCMGLKPHNDDDIEEGHAIVRGFAEDDAEAAKQEQQQQRQQQTTEKEMSQGSGQGGQASGQSQAGQGVQGGQGRSYGYVGPVIYNGNYGR